MTDPEWMTFADDPWNEIAPYLWMGGMYYTPQMKPCAPEGQFDVVVSMAGRGGPQTKITNPGITQHNFVIRDGELGKDELALAQEAAQIAADAVYEHQRVLVRCHMGLNRSGLVVALALNSLAVQPLSADWIIGKIREERSPDALFNPHFVEYIRSCV